MNRFEADLPLILHGHKQKVLQTLDAEVVDEARQKRRKALLLHPRAESIHVLGHGLTHHLASLM